MMHLVQLHQSLYAQRVAAPVLAFSFAPAERFTRWISLVLDAEMPREWRANTRFIADPSLRIYHAYGLGRNSPLRVYGPRILLHYALRWLRGHGIPKVAEDPLQRGGDFVVDAQGRIALSHVGVDQADRPPAERIVSALLRCHR
ncbi:MAG: hypothetical protein RMN52_04540 [Anaerolineae bacterium]|nr:AhpC/TSA family protein [Candidatus Roseilinea sp.]MDW8449250.1 hypothetical protein [Anaerolineae bacterium]